MPCYLYACGDLACFMHVLTPFCSKHPTELLIADLGTDRVIWEMRDLLSKAGSKGYLYSCGQGIRADLKAYIQEIVRNGGLFEEANQGNWGGEQIWACPLCQATHYLSESGCQCGFSYTSGTQYQETPVQAWPQEQTIAPIDNDPALLRPVEGPPPIEGKPLTPVTCEVEVQVQFLAESKECMTECVCEQCELAVPGSYWCKDCIAGQAAVCAGCKQGVVQREVLCEGCRVRNKPISCLKCGQYEPSPCCERCLVPIPPGKSSLMTQTDPLPCSKCSKSAPCSAICNQCQEPELPTCHLCQVGIAKDNLACDSCIRTAKVKCSRCPTALSSGQILCPQCISHPLPSAASRKPPSEGRAKPAVEELKHLEMVDDDSGEEITDEAQPLTPKCIPCQSAFTKKPANRKLMDMRISAALDQKVAKPIDTDLDPQVPLKFSTVTIPRKFNPSPPKREANPQVSKPAAHSRSPLPTRQMQGKK